MSARKDIRVDTGPVNSAAWAAGALGVSVAGLAAHNILEFGFGALSDFGSGTIPMFIVAAVIAAIWWLIPGARRICSALMIAFGLLNLVGGGLLSVLPLDFLPFDPEQSLSHYASHLFYGVTQIPLIWFGIGQLLPGT